MNGRIMTIFGSLALGALLLSVPASARKVPDIEILQSAKGSWLVCPAGDGPTLEESGLAVTLQLSLQGAPLERFPQQDLWLLGAENRAPRPCGFMGVMADDHSGADGVMTISGAWAAGGQGARGLVIYASGIPMDEADPPVPVLHTRVNSPDINGDGAVDLGDVASFAEDVVRYDFRSDLVVDGAVNLADLAVLMEHLGHRCP